MKYVLLFILWIVVTLLNHYQNSYLLSGNSVDVSTYIGATLLGPIIFTVIISAIICAITRKMNATRFIHCSCWILGFMLLIGIGNTLRTPTSWKYTFKATKISVSVPNRLWQSIYYKDAWIKEALMTTDGKASIYSLPVTDSQDIDDVIEDYKDKQRLSLPAQYNEKTFQFHSCEINHFICRYQEIVLSFNNAKKNHITYMLKNKQGAIVAISIAIDSNSTDKYAEEAKRIVLSATSSD
ncbi:hypothetical protein [Atlantibacter subterraneus]|uniref:hypothetical protein n=1 Tax=Atlantibacter subterraneus TaxID=255519 RepID=UPI00289F93FE|nr:hypothetical protein [Atlantibacter subterranea]